MDNLNFINQYSWKTFLGRQNKDPREIDGLFLWNVSKKNHFCTNKTLTLEDLQHLEYPTSFYYMSEDNVKFLKQHTKIKATKSASIYYDLSQFTLEGGDYKKLRQSINKAKKYNLTIQDSFNKIEDVKECIEEWSNILAEKYFRDFSGKNLYFFENGFHKDCNCIFLYDGNKLVAFGALSPDSNGYCSYIIGKALCHQYKGLSEYADYLLYQKCIANGTRFVNLGLAKKGLMFYKGKFPGANILNQYDGKIESLK